MLMNDDPTSAAIIDAVVLHNIDAEHAIKIAFIHSSIELPQFCAKEIFEPAPSVGIVVDRKLSGFLSKEYIKNPSIHDGALAFSLGKEGSVPRISAWGVRLYPPVLSKNRCINRGMAYNSSLQFSAVESVKRVLLFGVGEVIVFESGETTEIISC